MEDKYVNKLKMYNEVEKLCNDNAVIIATIPQFSAYLSQFSAKILSIKTKQQKQEEDIKRFAIHKEQLRLSLINKILTVSRKMLAFSVATSDSLLQPLVDLSYPELLHNTEKFLTQTANSIVEQATAYLPQLATYNVTQPMIDEISADQSAFLAVISDPLNASVLRKTLTSGIALDFREADTILKQKMDKLIEFIHDTNFEFYTNYKNARLIRDMAGHNISIEGKVLDSATASPVEGVIVELIEENSTYTTRNTGHFQFKSLPSGNYTIQASAKNYKSQLIPNIPVQDGKDFILNIRLERGKTDFIIQQDAEVCPWHGSTDSNLVITVRNNSANQAIIWAYLTSQPDGVIPPDKTIIPAGTDHEFIISEYQPAPVIYLRLRNTSPEYAASYTLIFSNILTQ